MTKNNSKKKNIYIFFGIGIIVISIVLAATLFANVAYGEKLFPNIKIANIDVGGMTKKQAFETVNAEVENYQKNNPNYELTFENSVWHPKISELGVEINVETAVNEAYKVGHQENFIISAYRQVQSVFVPVKIDLGVNFNEKKLNSYLSPIKSKYEISYVNESLKFNGLEIVESPGKNGRALDEEEMKAQINNLIQNLNQGKISLNFRQTYPHVKKDKTLKARAEAEKIISAPIYLKNGKTTYQITQRELTGWVVFDEKKIDNDKVDIFSEDVSKHFILIAQVSEKSLDNYAKFLANRINTTPQNARLRFINGKLRIVEKSKPGSFLDQKSLMADLKKIFEKNSERTVVLNINKLSSEINEKNISRLGIKDLISKGESNFAGSPNNRRHNIAQGASVFNGIIVKPGDIFSFTTILGDVSAKTGYLPELVIKEDKTIPEYGGGLCQVSTTAFRAAVLAGLPILERQPHSYRVSYYDWPYGPGFDSTVYIPHPDLSFRNDTGHYILIQTYISGSKLVFEFYGTKGSRSVKIQGPRVIKYLGGGALNAEFYQLVYQGKKLTRRVRFYSHYDSPAKYHH